MKLLFVFLLCLPQFIFGAVIPQPVNTGQTVLNPQQTTLLQNKIRKPGLAARVVNRIALKLMPKQYGDKGKKKNRDLGKISLICGIAAAVVLGIGFAVPAVMNFGFVILILIVLAFGFGARAIKRDKKNKKGLIGFLLSLLSFFVLIGALLRTSWGGNNGG